MNPLASSAVQPVCVSPYSPSFDFVRSLSLLYTKSSTTDGNAPSALHHSGANAKTIINSGYFYAVQDRTVSGGYGSITINGGYFDKAPGSSKVTYAEGLALTPLDPKATHVHKTTGATLEYGYQVK